MAEVGQKTKVLTVTVTAAGTAQRIVTDPDSPYRYMRSGYFTPAYANGSDAVYIGDESVTDAGPYTDRLVGTEPSRLTFSGDNIASARENRFNYLDLYNMWVDADSNGNELFVTIFEVGT